MLTLMQGRQCKNMAFLNPIGSEKPVHGFLSTVNFRTVFYQQPADFQNIQKPIRYSPLLYPPASFTRESAC
jgi:hypothetical protein